MVKLIGVFPDFGATQVPKPSRVNDFTCSENVEYPLSVWGVIRALKANQIQYEVPLIADALNTNDFS